MAHRYLISLQDNEIRLTISCGVPLVSRSRSQRDVTTRQLVGALKLPPAEHCAGSVTGEAQCASVVNHTDSLGVVRLDAGVDEIS